MKSCNIRAQARFTLDHLTVLSVWGLEGMRFFHHQTLKIHCSSVRSSHKCLWQWIEQELNWGVTLDTTGDECFSCGQKGLLSFSEHGFGVISINQLLVVDAKFYSLRGMCLSSRSKGKAERTSISPLDRKCFTKTSGDFLQKEEPWEEGKPF